MERRREGEGRRMKRYAVEDERGKNLKHALNYIYQDNSFMWQDYFVIDCYIDSLNVQNFTILASCPRNIQLNLTLFHPSDLDPTLRWPQHDLNLLAEDQAVFSQTLFFLPFGNFLLVLEGSLDDGIYNWWVRLIFIFLWLMLVFPLNLLPRRCQTFIGGATVQINGGDNG